MTEAAPTGRKQQAMRAFAIVAAALMLCWPALWNGFPLLFPDTLEYLGLGHGIIAQLRGIPQPPSLYVSDRPEIYAASLAFLHHGAALAPIVALQALLAAWILWLVTRSVRLTRPITTYLAVTAVTAALTCVSWHVGDIMPDILGPLVYLAFFLLAVTPQTQRPWENILLGAASLWCITAHGSNFLLAIGLGGFLASLWLLGWPGMRANLRGLAVIAALILIAATAQTAVHHRLYGKATLFGAPPPFLMARLIADGPASRYLTQNCPTLHWVLCQHVAHLPTTDGDFLWTGGSIWKTASPAEQAELRREQTPLLLATLRTYPLQQAAATLRNFGAMLITIGPADFGNTPDVFTKRNLDWATKGLADRYSHTRQSRNEMPQGFFARLQIPVTAAALVAVFALLPGLWRTRNTPLLTLAAVVLFVVAANAFLSGAISTLAPRYQGRIAWLLVYLAGLMLANAWEQRQRIATPR